MRRRCHGGEALVDMLIPFPRRHNPGQGGPYVLRQADVVNPGDTCAAAPERPYVTGSLSDGAIALIDLRADQSVLATLDRALE